MRPGSVHLDGAECLRLGCLFLREGHRGLKVGPQLGEAVIAEAYELGFAQIQWQTLPWNTGAINFYGRLGAQAKEKLPYHLSVD